MVNSLCHWIMRAITICMYMSYVCVHLWRWHFHQKPTVIKFITSCPQGFLWKKQFTLLICTTRIYVLGQPLLHLCWLIAYIMAAVSMYTSVRNRKIALAKYQLFMITFCQWKSKGQLKISATIQLVWWRVLTVSPFLNKYCNFIADLQFETQP